MSYNFNFNINVDANDLLNRVGLAGRCSYQSQYLDNGNARWISCQSGGKVISACYHKTKSHSATVETGGQGPFYTKNQSTAGPGEWAVAVVGSRGWDRTHYNF